MLINLRKIEESEDEYKAQKPGLDNGRCRFGPVLLSNAFSAGASHTGRGDFS
jgi:hypothetical protein